MKPAVFANLRYAGWLRPAVQEAVFDRRALNMGRYRRRSSLGHTLTMLESRADLESVAALVVLLREADELCRSVSRCWSRPDP